ncbi:CehA/McbA family metallohydrolase [Angustibacter sp. McL0619]|uniref:CehA/McbA family metallohydrolase n=1 Tax=Angustibacter sp. McL0619 TaxID=3415676 RepID=UPI003CECA3A3
MATHSHSHDVPAAGTEPPADESGQHPPGWTRRQVLAAGAAAVAVPAPMLVPQTAAAATSLLLGTNGYSLAMHVHGSWSEGGGSWEAQFDQAASTGIDVLYMSDHDTHATARGYLTSLIGIKWVRSTSGSLSQQASTATAGSLRLLAESRNSSPASVTMAVQPKPMAFNQLRTSISGHTLVHTVTSAQLTGGARYEIRVDLSYHPAASGRPAGQYRLVYRFGGTTSGRFTEDGGLTGVVTAPAPAAGSVQRLVPQADVAALWPSMLALDNGFLGLSFTVRSPRSGDVADVRVASVELLRTRSTPAAVSADQAQLVSEYQSTFPALAVRQITEISGAAPHMNPFGVPQYFPDYAALSSNPRIWHTQATDQVHAQGGLMSYNHPFGTNAGPLRSAAARTTKRRQVFADLQSVNLHHADLIEVGYLLRGNVDAATHLDLWDTFSRNGNFLTGNGTMDDHSGQRWRQQKNGFVTGAWAASRSEADLIAAMAAGRMYVNHLGKYFGGQLDLLVDGVVPMGAVSVSSKTSRQLTIQATALPANARVLLLTGPVDYAGAQDPGTVVTRTLAASAFSGGTTSVSVSTTASTFVRTQVLAADGTIIGASNPVWLLREQPPGGIPAARRVSA